MKKFYYLLCLLFFITSLSAKHVSLPDAKKIALHFMQSRDQKYLKFSEEDFTMNQIESSKLISMNFSQYFYSLNIKNGGFILVSADDRVEPILGYSLENSISNSSLPSNLLFWYSEYRDQIKYVIERNIPASSETIKLWDLYSRPFSQLNARGSQGVAPLVKTKWDQQPNYNAMCPNGSVVGCVATAMAQIMKYHSFPTNGQGSKSYNHSQYGTISANFGTATYDYSAMPISISGPNAEIAKLSYHCGVSVEMNYSPESSGADGAVVVKPALQNYFGYPTAEIEDRNTKSIEQWKAILKQDLDAFKPMYYEGLGGGSGHAFICDGYDDNDFFHFNWGWSGNSDGFYNINNLAPVDKGTGAGNGVYNSDQKIVRNITPPVNNNPAKLEMSDDINLTASTINYGGVLTAETNIVNTGSGKFQGDLGFVILSEAFEFLDTFGVYTNVTLNAGNTFQNPVPFYLSSRFSLLPEKYIMALCYRETGKDWTVVSKTNTYGNAANFSVVYANGIEMGSAYPTTIQKVEIGSSPSISLKFKNDYTSDLTGTYSLALYNLDGDFVQTLASVVDNTPLTVGSTHSSPLVFNSAAITAKPGSYLLATVFKMTGATDNTLVGSSYFKNPIKIIITDKPISPDAYEVNNSVNQSSNLPINMTGNTATVSTSNANIHDGDDIDYYKITVPNDGSVYNFNARLHDEGNSGNGNTYSLDAAFTFSLDGTNWVNGINTSMNAAVNVTSGQTIYFLVGPKFAGTVGTYQLDVNVTKGSASIAQVKVDKLKLYPIPCTDVLNYELNENLKTNANFSIYNSSGQKIFTNSISAHEKNGTININKLPSGQYFIELRNENLLIQSTLFIKQ